MIESSNPIEKVMDALNLKSKDKFRIKLINIAEMTSEMCELEDFFGRTEFVMTPFGLEISKSRKKRYDEDQNLLLKKAFYAICTGKCFVQKIKGIDIRTIYPEDWQNRSRPPQDNEGDTLILMRKSIANLLGVEAEVPFYLICKKKHEFSIMDEIPPMETSDDEEDIKEEGTVDYIHLGVSRNNFLYPVKLYFTEDDWSLACADWMLDSNGDIPQEDLGKYWDALLHGKISAISEFHEEFGIVAGFYFEEKNLENNTETKKKLSKKKREKENGND